MTTNSIPEGCKPFDLERALAGDPVVMRDGRPVTQLVKFDVGYDIDPLHGVLGNIVDSWRVDGRYWSDWESTHDLFMSPKKRTVWVNLYRDDKACWYDSEEVADACRGRGCIGGRAWPVEIEE